MSSLSASGIRNPFPRKASVPLKFLACSTVTTAAWLLFLGAVLSSPADGPGTASATEIWEFLPYFAGLTATVLPAALVYFHLPEETAGLTHRIGKGAALFIPVNVTLSAAVVIHELNRVGVSQGSTLALDAAGYWVIASLFLPGPYIGALIAARWSR